MKVPHYLTGVILVTVACGDHPAGGDTTSLYAVVRDSGQVRIIENPRPPAGSRLDWRIGTEPAVSIGELDGEEPYLLARVGDALALSDGRIVVVNGGSNELRIFDALGNHVATWGGRGEGPGEFTSLSRVYRWPGDSLLAHFSHGRRLPFSTPRATTDAPLRCKEAVNSSLCRMSCREVPSSVPILFAREIARWV